MLAVPLYEFGLEFKLDNNKVRISSLSDIKLEKISRPSNIIIDCALYYGILNEYDALLGVISIGKNSLKIRGYFRRFFMDNCLLIKK